MMEISMGIYIEILMVILIRILIGILMGILIRILMMDQWDGPMTVLTPSCTTVVTWLPLKV